MGHITWDNHWHRHADNQIAEPVYLVGMLHCYLLPVTRFCHPPCNISFEAARTPLFELAHHDYLPIIH
ncbi:hypothetical protein [Lelliottia amnigena]|uniref:Uncharacterized protein n=1 Tax=Lelliottia amnigena TaxID=61646 RepID=A0ABU7UAL4_LELAM